MGGRPEDAEAPTLAQTAPERSSRPAISQLTTGATIGRYRLETRLGAGAMGVVWSAHDPQLDRKIAIKLVHPALARSDEAAGRLLREARAMAKLSHRAVVTVHDAGDEAGQLFIAMELVDGTNLGTLLRSRPPGVIADWARWLAMLLDAGRGLAHAHAHGVLHRDFKPDNVLVDDRGRVCVGDFGLATLGEDALAAAASRRESKAELDLTTTGALLGTPAYMSPQGLRGEEIDARADQFSFCVAAWEAVYGARPFLVEGTGLDAIPELTDKIEAGALPPAPDGSTVPDAVRAVLARGLAAAPDARWPDMETLLAELSRASRARPATAAPVAAPPRRTGLVLGLVGAGAIAAVAIAFAVGRRGAEPAPPPPSPPRASSGVIAKRLFSVPLRTGLALSADGRYLATNSDRVTVREVDGRGLWAALLPQGTGEVYGLDFEADELRFSVRREAKLYRWRFASGENPVDEPFRGVSSGHWYGRTERGEVVWHPDDRVLQLWSDGREVTRWPVQSNVDACRISPDRRRIAYLESGRFTGRIVIRDVVQDRELAARELVAPTAIAWRDDATLLYATGALEQPRIWSMSLGDDGLGAPVELYGLDHGWFGQIQAHDDRLFVIQMQPSPRARLVERSGTSATPRDLDHASVALGWTSPTEFLSWSRTNHRVERRDARSTVELLAAELDGEPANATIAGDVLIAALRRNTGRETVAVSLADGRTLWRHPDGRTIAVRCAGDRAPPCFAIRALADGDQLVTLDPATGELGTAPIHRGRIEDVAVDAAGARLLLVGDGRRIHEIAPTGAVLAQHDGISASVRSVAWDPTGGFLIGGTVLRNTFTVGRVHDGTFSPLVTTGDDLLSMVRPSPDGAQVLLLARLYAPEVWQLQLPR